jgi:DEAD/DEAH box helicase domain-containing protein
VVIYDNIPGGIGLSERLFDLQDELVARASEVIAACPCEDGCPSCVGPAGENGVGGKRETQAIFSRLSSDEDASISQPVDAASIIT